MIQLTYKQGSDRQNPTMVQIHLSTLLFHQIKSRQLFFFFNNSEKSMTWQTHTSFFQSFFVLKSSKILSVQELFPSLSQVRIIRLSYIYDDDDDDDVERKY